MPLQSSLAFHVLGGNRERRQGTEGASLRFQPGSSSFANQHSCLFFPVLSFMLFSHSNSLLQPNQIYLLIPELVYFSAFHLALLCIHQYLHKFSPGPHNVNLKKNLMVALILAPDHVLLGSFLLLD